MIFVELRAVPVLGWLLLDNRERGSLPPLLLEALLEGEPEEEPARSVDAEIPKFVEMDGDLLV